MSESTDNAAANVYTMELSRPIPAHGEEVSELTLRDPVSGALEGVELTLGPGGLKIDLGAMLKIVASAADIPLSSARKIPMRDLLANFTGILDFFGVDIRTTGES